MKISDVNAFKGKFKDAIVSWSDGIVDQMFPSRVAVRTFLKNARSNILVRLDDKINKMVDTAFLVLGDANGVVDTDSTIDLLCDMFKEMPQKDYSFGGLGAKVGKGEILIQFPHNFFSDFFVGDMGGVKLTTEDIKQLKNYLS